MSLPHTSSAQVLCTNSQNLRAKPPHKSCAHSSPAGPAERVGQGEEKKCACPPSPAGPVAEDGASRREQGQFQQIEGVLPLEKHRPCAGQGKKLVPGDLARPRACAIWNKVLTKGAFPFVAASISCVQTLPSLLPVPCSARREGPDTGWKGGTRAITRRKA